MSEFEIVTTKDFVAEIRNFQIFPAYIRVELNDRITKVLFNLDSATHNELRKGVSFDIVEKQNHKKHGEISTPFSFVSPYTAPLTEFDRAVLGVCTSEFLAGNICTTPSVIFRALVGKVGEGDKEPSKNQKSAILNSISKLLATVVKFDTTQSFQKLNYEGAKIVESAILPCCHIQAKINGQVADVIRFDRISPFYDTSDAKNQIVRYPVELLDVPNQNNTPLVIALKNYVLRRVAEIKAHKMTPTITFEDVFAKCGIDGASRFKKEDARNAVVKLFEHLRNKNFITFFEPEKRGTSIHGIKFTYIFTRQS